MEPEGLCGFLHTSSAGRKCSKTAESVKAPPRGRSLLQIHVKQHWMSRSSFTFHCGRCKCFVQVISWLSLLSWTNNLFVYKLELELMYQMLLSAQTRRHYVHCQCKSARFHYSEAHFIIIRAHYYACNIFRAFCALCFSQSARWLLALPNTQAPAIY